MHICRHFCILESIGSIHVTVVLLPVLLVLEYGVRITTVQHSLLVPLLFFKVLLLAKQYRQ